jgi:hypothetical protein
MVSLSSDIVISLRSAYLEELVEGAPRDRNLDLTAVKKLI